jgi:hypothetical protein
VGKYAYTSIHQINATCALENWEVLEIKQNKPEGPTHTLESQDFSSCHGGI